MSERGVVSLLVYNNCMLLLSISSFHVTCFSQSTLDRVSLTPHLCTSNVSAPVSKFHPAHFIP